MAAYLGSPYRGGPPSFSSTPDDRHKGDSDSIKVKVAGGREFCLQRLEEALLNRDGRSELPSKKSYYLCELADLLRGESLAGGRRDRRRDDASSARNEDGFLDPSNLQRMARIVLDLMAMTDDSNLLDTALEVTMCIVSVLNCSAEESSRDMGALLKRAWFNLQVAEDLGGNRTAALLRVSLNLMSSLQRRDPLEIVTSTQTSSSSSSSFVARVLNSLADANESVVEARVAVLHCLWDCHMQYSGASFLKSFFFDNAAKILGTLVDCHVGKHSNPGVKVSCSNFVLRILESPASRVLNLGQSAELPARGGALDRSHSLRGSSPATSAATTTTDLLIIVAKDCLVSPNAEVASNGTRLARFVVDLSIRTQRPAAMDPDFVDHVINLGRTQALQWARGAARNQNLRDGAEAATMATLRDICAFAQVPDPCLHRALDVCLLWLDQALDFFDKGFVRETLDLAIICLDKTRSCLLRPSTITALLRVLEGATIPQGKGKSAPSFAECECVLRILESVVSQWCRDKESAHRHARACSKCCALILSTVCRFTGAHPHHGAEEDEAVRVLVMGLRALGKGHGVLAGLSEKDLTETREVSASLEDLYLGFADVLIPLTMSHLSSNQTSAPLRQAFASSLTVILEPLPGTVQGSGLESYGKSIAAQLLSSNIVFLLASAEGSPQSAQDIKLCESLRILVTKLVPLACGRPVKTKCLGLLGPSERPFTMLVDRVLAQTKETGFCAHLEDCLNVLTCALFHCTNLGENAQLSELIQSALNLPVVRSHLSLALHCKSVLGFIGPERMQKEFPPLWSTIDELTSATSGLTPMTHVGLLAWLSKIPEEAADNRDAECALLSIFAVMKSSPDLVGKLFEVAPTDKVVSLARIALTKVVSDHERLDTAKMLNFLAFFQALSRVNEFRICIFSERFLVQVAEVLRCVLGKEAAMPEGLRDAMLSREVFYLLFAFLGSRDCGSSQGCESETQGGWLAFLRGVQGTLIPLTVEEGKTQKAKFPMAQLMTLLSEVALTGQMVGDLGALMRLALRSSEIAILSGVQTSWEEAPVPLSSAVGFLTAISGVEVESLTGSASAEERMEEDGEPGEGEGLLLGEAWTSFPFAKVLCAVSKMVQGKTKASFDFGSIASLSSSLFALWSASQGEKAECIDSLNDEMELGMFSLLSFVQGGAAGEGSLGMKIKALECIHNMAACRLLHRTLRQKLLYYPWNALVFRSILLSFYTSRPSSPGFALCMRLLDVLSMYNDPLFSPPGWLRRFVRKHHSLLAMVCNNHETKHQSQARLKDVQGLL